MTEYPSIFNDVLSPVTAGPSSSNTSAPNRIARLILSLLDHPLKHVKVEMSKQGGFPLTFYSMDSDIGLLSGFMGKDTNDFDGRQAIYDCFARNESTCDFLFIEELPSKPAELMLITVTDQVGRTHKITAASLGGGRIQISRIDNFQVNIDGQHYSMLIGIEPAEDNAFNSNLQSILGSIEKLTGRKPSWSISMEVTETLIQIDCEEKQSVQLINEIQRLPCVRWVRQIAPVYFSTKRLTPAVPFRTCSEMESYIRESGRSVIEAAYDYETAVCCCTKEEIDYYSLTLIDIILNSVEAGYHPAFTYNGMMAPFAKTIINNPNIEELYPSGLIANASFSAIAAMEYSNSHGKIVCMPTGGSSGVIAGFLHTLYKEKNMAKKDLPKLLLAAGLYGLFLYETGYSGFLGCQAEIGSAAAMGAAMLASSMTNDISKISAAASLSLQSFIGLVCDPVAGCVQIPCIIRNAAAVSVAATMANMAVLGYPASIPFDEMAKAVLEVGNKLDGVNFCGTCTTASGQALSRRMSDKNYTV